MSISSSTLTLSPSSIGNSQVVSASSTGNTRVLQLMKSLYQADQQLKYLHLQAEVETLLQELQTLKQQRLTPDYRGSASYDGNDNKN